jgi:hypothetical protein
MKKLRFLPIIALVLSSFTTADTMLTDAERKSAISYLKETKEDLLKTIKGLSAEQLAFKATPESWSVAECVEHIAITESGLFGMMQGTLKEAANPSRRSEVKMTDEQVKGMISSRERKVKTQENMEPKNNFGSVEGSIKEFITKRDATIEYVKFTKDDLRNHYAAMPFGTFDSYQVILFLGGHSARHTVQAKEVIANSNFPKK